MKSFEIINSNIYIITAIGPKISMWGPKRRHHYINFNTNSKSQNPMLVTDIGHKAISQVYFQSEDEAQDFLNTFIYLGEGRRNNIDFRIVKYKGPYQVGLFEKVTTKYGDCLKAKILSKN